MIETTSTPAFNRKSIFGFIAALIAFFALCTGSLPLPFTVLLCYPPGIILGIAALVLGIQAQREIRQRNENGRVLAIISVWAGAITIIATLCVITAGVMLYPHISEFVHKIWQQINS